MPTRSQARRCIYQELLAESSAGRFDRDRLFEVERRYSLRLMEGVPQLQNSGISGWMKYQAKERPVVRASTIYWTALRSWQIAGPVAGMGDAPTESQLQAAWPKLLSRDDSDALRISVATYSTASPPRLTAGRVSPAHSTSSSAPWRRTTCAGSGGTPDHAGPVRCSAAATLCRSTARCRFAKQLFTRADLRRKLRTTFRRVSWCPPAL